jgi:hypothetical protein
MSLISFGKTAAGNDALDIAGHEIPVSFLAAGAAAIGGLLVLRARSSGSNVASVGTPAAAIPATTATDPNATDLSGLSDAVAALSNELSGLNGQVQGLGTPPPSTVPSSTPNQGAESQGPRGVSTMPPAGSHPIAPAPPGPHPLPSWPGSSLGAGASGPKSFGTPHPIGGHIAPVVASPATMAARAALTSLNLNRTPSPPKPPLQTEQIIRSAPHVSHALPIPVHSPAVPHPSAPVALAHFVKPSGARSY